MTDAHLALLMLGVMLFVIMLGFPIAFSLLALALFFGFYAMDFRVFELTVENTNEAMTNDVLVSLPLFLFMGYMVERARVGCSGAAMPSKRVAVPATSMVSPSRTCVTSAVNGPAGQHAPAERGRSNGGAATIGRRSIGACCGRRVPIRRPRA